MKTKAQLKAQGRICFTLLLGLPFAVTASINFLPWWLSVPLVLFILFWWVVAIGVLRDTVEAVKKLEGTDGKEA